MGGAHAEQRRSQDIMVRRCAPCRLGARSPPYCLRTHDASTHAASRLATHASSRSRRTHALFPRAEASDYPHNPKGEFKLRDFKLKLPGLGGDKTSPCATVKTGTEGFAIMDGKVSLSVGRHGRCDRPEHTARPGGSDWRRAWE